MFFGNTIPHKVKLKVENLVRYLRFAVTGVLFTIDLKSRCNKKKNMYKYRKLSRLFGKTGPSDTTAYE